MDYFVAESAEIRRGPQRKPIKLRHHLLTYMLDDAQTVRLASCTFSFGFEMKDLL